MKYQKVSSKDLKLISRGNFYHLAHGEPKDLSFPHVTLEVDFWKHVGIWLDDQTDKWVKYNIHVVRTDLQNGKTDAAHSQSALGYSRIVLPMRFAKFKERSRAASLEYLKSYAGKRPIDVVPHETMFDYTYGKN